MDNLTFIPNDGECRNKIINELDKNFFVEAGAGSGKTTMLVNRMVALVESGKEVDKICAITFTKAAAAEFYKRFQKLLSDRSVVDKKARLGNFDGELPLPTEETAANCRKALENIDLCFMNTIDSFCQMVLSEHPMEAEIPVDATILEEADMKVLYEQEYVKIRNGEHGEDLKKKADLFKRFYIDDVDTFIYGVGYIMERRNVTFHFEPANREMLDFDAYFEEDKQKLIRTVQALVNNSDYRAWTRSAAMIEAWSNLQNILHIITKPWSTNLKQVIKAMKNLESLIHITVEGYQNRDVEKAFFKPCNRTNRDGKEFISYYYFELDALKKIMDLQYSITLELLTESVKSLEKDLKASGNLSYFDYLYFLRNMLDKDALEGGKLARHIFSRHHYIFIDEFQDTNPMQAEIFFHLTAKESKEKWFDCIPEAGSLFIVGDPKQSIYKFRAADVASYIKVKKLFCEDVGEVLKLTKNFRSREVLTTYFNFAFERAMPEDTNVQCKYNDITIQEDKYKDSKIFQGIYTYDAYTGNSLATPDSPYLDEKQVVKIIQRLVNNENYVIIDEKTKRPRLITYKDFMIISFSKGNLQKFITKFMEEKIPFKSEGKVLFEECPSLKACYDILGVIANPRNSLTLISALKSEVLGFTDKDILCFASKYGKDAEISIFKDYEIEEQDKFGLHFYDALRQIRVTVEKASVLTPASVFYYIMENFQIFNKVPATNLEVLYYTLELIRGAQKSGKIIQLDDCVKYIGELLSGKSPQERCLSLTADENCVHLANLHKVKGLEAPIVILTYWYPQEQHAGTFIEYKDESTDGYIISCEEQTGAAPKVYFKTEQFEEQARQDVESAQAEIERLIYVAATRPKNALIMCRSHSVEVGNIKSRWADRLFDKKKRVVANQTQEPSLSDFVKDFFETAKDNETVFVPQQNNVASVAAYDSAINAAKIKPKTDELRENEEKTFTVITPSTAKTESKFDAENNEGGTVEKTSGNNMDNEKAKSKGKINPVHWKPDLLGTVVHKLMEMLVSSKGAVAVDAAIEDIIEEYVAEDMSDYAKKLRPVLKEIANVILNGGYEQSNSNLRDIFDTLMSADEVHCEVPFCYKKDKEIWNGIMDVIYKKDGAWHIVDYKTNVDGTNLDEEYATQLQAYKDAFKAMMGEEADAVTYHIAI